MQKSSFLNKAVFHILVGHLLECVSKNCFKMTVTWLSKGIAVILNNLKITLLGFIDVVIRNGSNTLFVN